MIYVTYVAITLYTLFSTILKVLFCFNNVENECGILFRLLVCTSFYTQLLYHFIFQFTLKIMYLPIRIFLKYLFLFLKVWAIGQVLLNTSKLKRLCTFNKKKNIPLSLGFIKHQTSRYVAKSFIEIWAIKSFRQDMTQGFSIVYFSIFNFFFCLFHQGLWKWVHFSFLFSIEGLHTFRILKVLVVLCYFCVLWKIY